MIGGYSGIIGLLVLVADVWAIVSIGQSGTTTETKVLWIVLVLILPVFGFLIWLLAGPRAGRA
ncbi:MAG TPA: PLD nuclease N-terminal domain-containing protein [Burkholderiales bacterium]|nr:PLD nuclease N-terminal domain-containing protein [Burkholderiales bacterium]